MTETARLQIRADSTGITTAERDLAKLERQGRRTEKATDGFTRSVQVATQAVAAIGIGVAVTRLARYADEWQNVTNRLKLATESSDELARAQEAVFAIAQETRSGLSETAELYQRLSLNAGEYIQSQEDLANITRTVNQAVALSGGSHEAASAAITQFNQALASGQLRGEEFNSVLEQAPRLAQALADGLGVGIGKLRELAAQGALTSDRLLTALRNQAQGISKEFEGLSPLISQSFNAIEKSATRAIGKLDEMTGASSAVADALISASEAIDAMVNDTESMAGVLEGAGDAAKVAAAIIAGRLVSALKVSTTETIAKIAALRAQGAEELRAAQAAAAKATAEKSAAVATQQSLVSTLQAAQGERTRTAIRAQMAAQAAVIVTATNAETAATARLAAAQKTATLTSRALGGSLALLGGPVGIATTAALALIFFRKELFGATNKARDLTEEVNKLTTGIYGLTEAQLENRQANLVADLAEQARKATELRARVDELTEAHRRQAKELQRRSTGRFEGRPIQIQGLSPELTQARDELEAIETQMHATSLAMQKIQGVQSDLGASGTGAKSPPAPLKIDENASRTKLSDLVADLRSEEEEIQASYERRIADIQRLTEEGSALRDKLEAKAKQRRADELQALEDQRRQEFDSLYAALRSEEEAIEDSYLRRRSIIKQNTEEGSALQEELLEKAQGIRDQELQALKDRKLQEIEVIRESFLTEQEMLIAKFEADREIILSNTEITETQRQELLLGLQERYRRERAAAEARTNAELLKNGEALFDGLAGITEAFAGKQSKLYKVLFAASKGFAIAEAIVNIQAALAKAANAPFPLNLAQMAIVAAQTAGIISTIKGTNFAGAFDSGGVIPSGQVGLVGEVGPELVQGPAVVTSRKKTADMLNNQTKEKVEIHFTVNANDSRSFQESMVENQDVITGIVEAAYRRRGRRGIA